MSLLTDREKLYPTLSFSIVQNARILARLMEQKLNPLHTVSVWGILSITVTKIHNPYTDTYTLYIACYLCVLRVVQYRAH
jgi:hypothetical protein